MDPTALPTRWDVPDAVWTMSEAILHELDPANPPGHRRVDLRRVLNGTICRLRTGCQGHPLPKQCGDDRTVPRHCQRWCPLGGFARSGAVLVQAGDELGGVDWPWHAADTALGKPRRGGDLVGRHPTDRGNQGGTRRLVGEADGGPRGAAIAGAHVQATTLVAATREAMVVERPQPTEEAPPQLCLDKGEDHPTGRETAAASQYTPHSRRMGEDTRAPHGQKTSPARRGVVERTWAWLSTCRGLLVRDEKQAIHCAGLLPLACALIWRRRRAR